MLKLVIHSSISEKALVEYIGVCTDTYYGTPWFKIQNMSTSGCKNDSVLIQDLMIATKKSKL